MSRLRISEAAVSELNALSESNGGLLKPEHVLERARSKRSALHTLFTWDNARAGELRRLDEARAIIISVKVRIEARPHEPPMKVRAYVSLAEDRVTGGGYRPITVVLRDSSQRAQLLRTAIQEFAALRKKYEALAELTKLYDELDAVLFAQSQQTG